MTVRSPDATLVSEGSPPIDGLMPVVVDMHLQDGDILTPDEWGKFFQGSGVAGFLRELIATAPGTEYYLIGSGTRPFWAPIGVSGGPGTYQVSLLDIDLCADPDGMKTLGDSGAQKCGNPDFDDLKLSLPGVDVTVRGLIELRDQHKLGNIELKNWASGIKDKSPTDPTLIALLKDIEDYQVPDSDPEFVASCFLFTHESIFLKLREDGSLVVCDRNKYLERHGGEIYPPLEINPYSIRSLYLRAFEYFDRYPLPKEGFASYVPVWTIRNIDRMLVDVCERGMWLDMRINLDNPTYRLIKNLVEMLSSNNNFFDQLHALDFIKKEGISLNDSWYREAMWFNAIRAFISHPLILYQLISWDLPLLREVLFGDLAKSTLTEDEQFRRFRGAGMYGIFHPGPIKVGVYDSWQDYHSYERVTFVTQSVSEIISLFLFAFGVNSEDPRIKQFVDSWSLKGEIKANPLISSLPHRMGSKLDCEVIKTTIWRLNIVYSLYRNRGRSN
ncbi:hypothetical protein JW962_00345 [Candidatus Dojkabacteria bacterium]|nr:hypothetical protein [Candidatus Dojkabacteria bacterium]